MTLLEILNDDTLRTRFLKDGEALIAQQVQAKRGLSGMAVKAGFKAIQKVSPSVINSALQNLLPAFQPVIEPYFEQGQNSAEGVAAYFQANASEIAEAMLSVTDRKANGAKNKVLKKTYAGLRGQARQHTTDAIPAVGALLQSYLS